MEFASNKPIYQQIVDFCFSRILQGDWQAETRVPSVRELAMSMAVNSHTVLKSYEYLQAQNIIYPKRGLGFFLSADARECVMKLCREEFYSTTLRELFVSMDNLGISIDDIVEHYRQR
jgi:DNA-binding transcriptional regulator YhcF (GntR family)